MNILEVNDLRKVCHTTRFGGQSRGGAARVTLCRGGGQIRRRHGRSPVQQNHPFEHSGGAGPTHLGQVLLEEKTL